MLRTPPLPPVPNLHIRLGMKQQWDQGAGLQKLTHRSCPQPFPRPPVMDRQRSTQARCRCQQRGRPGMPESSQE